MMCRKIALLLVFFVFCNFQFTFCDVFAQEYSFQTVNLGPRDEFNSSSGGGDFTAWALNNNSSFIGVGMTYNDDICSHGECGYIWNAGVLVPIVPTELMSGNLVVNDINDLGHVVGTYVERYADINHGFLWMDGVLTDLGPNTRALGINNSGQIVGSAKYGENIDGTDIIHAVLWNQGTMIHVASYVMHAQAEDINDNGDVVGILSLPEGGEWRGFIWRNNVLTDLGAVSTNPYSKTIFINNPGDVLYTVIRPIVWSNGVITEFFDPGNLGGYITATGFNDSGDIIGIGDGGPVLWSKGEFVQIPTLFDSDEVGVFQNYVCVAINNKGEILGNGVNSVNQFGTVLISPVSEKNLPPVMLPIGNKVVLENELLILNLSSVDPEGDTLTYSADNLPDGASFDSLTATFRWVPTYAQAGEYQNVEFTVTDNGTPLELATQLITITVSNANRAPVFASLGTKQAKVGQALIVSPSAIDPDGDQISYTVSNLPAGATFDSLTHILTWTPTVNQVGTYVVTINGIDDNIPTATGTTELVISVGPVSAIDLTEEVIFSILDLSLPQELENSYLASVKKIEPFLQAGKVTPAINQIESFVNKIQKDLEKGLISQVSANAIIQKAQYLKSILQP